MATLWGGAEDGWVISGGDSGDDGIPALYKNVAWLYRAVNLVAGAVSSIPFSITKAGSVIDSSTDYMNRVGYLPSPKRLIYLVTAALQISGKAYLWREYNALKTTGLRYILPSSVECIIDPVKGLTGFKRYAGTQSIQAGIDDIIYFWGIDPLVEIGPPLSYPAAAALKAAKVLLNVDEFAAAFFKRGAIKTTIFEAEGINPQERESFLTWWKRRLTGIKQAFSTNIINAKNMKPIVIGEGIQELTNVQLTREEKEAIATALGIPFAILFSDAANYATAQQDWLNFLNNTALPIAELIAENLNNQLFYKQGLKFTFEPEGMDAFQEDENAKAQSLGTLVTALVSGPEEAEIAMQILGYEMSEDTRILFDALLARRKESRESVVQPAQTVQPAESEAPKVEPMVDNSDTKRQLEQWQRKAIKALKAGRSADVEFVFTCPVDRYLVDDIADALSQAQTIEDVKSAFALAVDQPKPMDITPLVDELKATRKALEDEMNQEPAPVINVYVPEQPAPVVNVSVPAPVVNVAAPVVNPPAVNVNLPKEDRSNFVVKRDADGRIAGIEER